MAEGEGQAVAMTTGPAAGAGEINYPSTAPAAVASAPPSAPDAGPGGPPGQYGGAPPVNPYAQSQPVQYQQQPQYPPQQQVQYVQPVQAGGYAQPPPGQQYQQPPVQYQQPMGQPMGQPQQVVYTQQPTQQFAPQPVQYAGQPGYAPAVPAQAMQVGVVPGTAHPQGVQMHVTTNYYTNPLPGTGQYSTSLFGCENLPLCIYVCMCPACAMGDISRNVNGSYCEGCVIACCVPCFYTCATGKNVQVKYGIQSNCLFDFCLYTFCCECYLARDLAQSRVKINGQ